MKKKIFLIILPQLFLLIFFPSLIFADECPSRSIGDINCDRETNQQDLEYLLNLWNYLGEIPGVSLGDINNDNKVEEKDLHILLFNWLRTFAPTSTPTLTPTPSASPTLTPPPTTNCPSVCPEIIFYSSGIEGDQQTCYVKLVWNPSPSATVYRVYRNAVYKETTNNHYTWHFVPCNNNSLYKVQPTAPNCQEISCSPVAVRTPPLPNQ
ncbi:MAG: hypothetical protein ACPLKP_03175 [Microgenomates group bacterium]